MVAIMGAFKAPKTNEENGSLSALLQLTVKIGQARSHAAFNDRDQRVWVLMWLTALMKTIDGERVTTINPATYFPEAGDLSPDHKMVLRSLADATHAELDI